MRADARKSTVPPESNAEILEIEAMDARERERIRIALAPNQAAFIEAMVEGEPRPLPGLRAAIERHAK